MKKLLLGLLILPYFAGAETIELSLQQRVYIESRYPNADKITLVESETHRKAVLSLTEAPNFPTKKNGYFILDLGPQDALKQHLEVFTSDGDRLFPYVAQVPNTRFVAIVLFKTKADRDGFITRSKNTIKIANAPNNLKSVKGSNGKLSVEESKKAAMIKQRESEKSRLELELQVAQQRQADIEAFQNLSSNEQSEQKSQAKSLATEGFAEFQKNNFKKAHELFRKSMKLDPTVDQTYFQYAVNLYKQNRFNESLAYLSAVQGGDVNQTEYSYYVALNLMKVREYDKAVKVFEEIRDENNPDLSPISAFFAGSLLFQLQKYPEAKKNFEFVLDNSKDPKMDAEADSMIEQINRIEQYLESLKEIFRYSLTGGLIYDENILNVATENTNTNTKGYRLMYGGGIYYHLYRSQATQSAASLNFSDMYTMDTKFGADSTLQAADPMSIALTFPTQFQTQIGKSPLGVTLTPGYNQLIMNADGSGRKLILTTASLGSSVMMVPDPKRVSAYGLDYSRDTSLLTGAADDNLSGNRFKLSTSQTWLVGANGQNSFAWALAYTTFNASGKNSSNNKTETSLSYSLPGIWNFTATPKVGYSILEYPLNSNGRKDTTITAGIMGMRSFGTVALITSLDYTKNQSSIDTYVYNKFALTMLLSYSGSVSRK